MTIMNTTDTMHADESAEFLASMQAGEPAPFLANIKADMPVPSPHRSRNADEPMPTANTFSAFFPHEDLHRVEAEIEKIPDPDGRGLPCGHPLSIEWTRLKFRAEFFYAAERAFNRVYSEEERSRATTAADWRPVQDHIQRFWDQESADIAAGTRAGLGVGCHGHVPYFRAVEEWFLMTWKSRRARAEHRRMPTAWGHLLNDDAL